MLAGNLFALSKIFMGLSGFCAYRLYEIDPGWNRNILIRNSMPRKLDIKNGLKMSRIIGDVQAYGQS